MRKGDGGRYASAVDQHHYSKADGDEQTEYEDRTMPLLLVHGELLLTVVSHKDRASLS
jgi:hypothetical protein